jgi:hypothetical protein
MHMCCCSKTNIFQKKKKNYKDVKSNVEKCQLNLYMSVDVDVDLDVYVLGQRGVLYIRER